MATLKINPHDRKEPRKKKHILSERVKPVAKSKGTKLEVSEEKYNVFSGNAALGWLKVVFSSFNFLISLLLTLMVLIVQIQKPLIQSMLGSQFTLDVLSVIILGVLYLLYSIFEQFNAIYYLKGNMKLTKITAAIKFLISLIMIFSILYLIFNHGIQWFGTSIFGNTSLGKNQLFYIPSIVYLTYSVFLSLLSYFDILK
jgi:hypothetical protein